MSIYNLYRNALKKINIINSIKELEEIRLLYLGKNGLVTKQLSLIKDIAPENRKSFGAEINKIKELITKSIDDRIEKVYPIDILRTGTGKEIIASITEEEQILINELMFKDNDWVKATCKVLSYRKRLLPLYVSLAKWRYEVSKRRKSI